jgi:predicted alpha/beta superfamily hydrolase
MTDRARRSLLLALATPWIAPLAGCGGGGGSGGGDGAATPLTGGPGPGFASYTSARTGTTYPLRVHVPAVGDRAAMPVVFALDGDSWFDTLVALSAGAARPFIVVAIGNLGALRNRDYVPANVCTTGGGGHAAFFDFLRTELLPDVQAQLGGDPARRALLGHSHGGSFVLYAMFAQRAGQHAFSAYVSCDASIGCMPDAVYGWEADYRTLQATLPVRLHLSHASQGNAQANTTFAQLLGLRGYTGLTWREQAYTGTHGGIVPQAYADALAFVLA